MIYLLASSLSQQFPGLLALDCQSLPTVQRLGTNFPDVINPHEACTMAPLLGGQWVRAWLLVWAGWIRT
jgi:hypothetical protein